MLLRDLCPNKIEIIVSNFYLKSLIMQKIYMTLLVHIVHKHLGELFQLLIIRARFLFTVLFVAI